MATPTLQELVEGIIADIEGETGAAISDQKKDFLRALAAVQAAKLKLIYLAIAKVQKNIFPDTADPESEGGTLQRFGRVVLGRAEFAAQQGRYEVTFTGTPGAVVPLATRFRTDDGSASPGQLFVNDTVVTIPATGTIQAELRALEGGAGSRLDVSDTLTATSPLLNINDQVQVVSETVAPTERETITNYRQDIVNQFRLEPQGGSGADYRLWSSDAAGARIVFPYVVSGSSGLDVEVFVEAEIADSTDGKGTPSPAVLADVEEVIRRNPDTTLPPNEDGRLPLGVDLTVSPVTPLDVVINIGGAVDFTTQDQQLVEDELGTTVQGIRPFISGVDIPSEKNDILSLNLIITVIQTVVGQSKTFQTVDFTVDGVAIPVERVFEDGDIPFLSQVNFV
jgi:hypothetical protein